MNATRDPNCALSHPHSPCTRCQGGTTVSITCRACGHHLDRSDAICQAGPGRANWYCADTDACRKRMCAS